MLIPVRLFFKLHKRGLHVQSRDFFFSTRSYIGKLVCYLLALCVPTTKYTLMIKQSVMDQRDLMILDFSTFRTEIDIVRLHLHSEKTI